MSLKTELDTEHLSQEARDGLESALEDHLSILSTSYLYYLKGQLDEISRGLGAMVRIAEGTEQKASAGGVRDAVYDAVRSYLAECYVKRPDYVTTSSPAPDELSPSSSRP